MRARLARGLRVIADLLAGQPELDALRLENRQLRIDLDFTRRKLVSESNACERYIAERDRALGQASFWAGESAKTTRIMIDMGDARDAAVRPALAAPSGATVVHPVFGRRNRPAAPTLPGPAA